MKLPQHNREYQTVPDAMHTIKDVDAPDVHAIGRISELFVHALCTIRNICIISKKMYMVFFCSGILATRPRILPIEYLGVPLAVANHNSDSWVLNHV